jgi:long-chain-fatty-acid--CoA ligase ACSBG
MPKKFCIKADDVFDIQMGTDPNTDARPAITFWQAFAETRVKYGEENAYIACEQKDTDTTYFTSPSLREYTFNETYADAHAFGRALIATGLKKYQAVNVIGFNSYQWVIADIGAMTASALAAGVYATNNEDACQYQAEHSEAHTVVVEGDKQLLKYQNILDDKVNGGLPKLKVIVAYNMSPDAVDAQKPQFKKHNVQLFEWKEFLEVDAAKQHAAELDKRMADQKPGNCIKLIYTSGTTGRPKAVMISHDNMVWTSNMMASHMGGVHHTDRMVSYLPLSHIAAQLLDIGLACCFGGKIYFARPDALRGTIGETLKSVQPNIFFGVPRVWEKIAAKIKAAGANTKGIKKSIATWAKGLGMQYSEDRQGIGSDGKPNYNNVSAPCGYGCASCIVFSKVAAALGLTQCRMGITGAAPIAKETLDFYSALNFPVMEVYGQSECTGPATCTTPEVGWKAGTVGPTIPGTTLRINPVNQQIEYTGRHIFMGYLKMQQKTEDTFCDDGYLASGDQGKLDSDFFLSITGRIKELIIGAGGENIAPVPIEKAMKKAMPWLSNCIVFGERKPYLGMFVSLTCVMDPATMRPTDQLEGASLNFLKSIGSDATTYSAAQNDEKLRAAIDAGMKAGNAETISAAQTAKFWIWLPEDLSMPADTLGPTLKMKRGNVYKQQAETIEAGYAANNAKFASKKKS